MVGQRPTTEGGKYREGDEVVIARSASTLLGGLHAVVLKVQARQRGGRYRREQRFDYQLDVGDGEGGRWFYEDEIAGPA